MRATRKGMNLAAANAAVIAFELVVTLPVGHGDRWGTMILLWLGSAPIVLPLGAVAGWLACRLTVHRLFLLALFALASVVGIACVVAYGHPTDIRAIVLLGSPPSVVAALFLERWTRPPPSPLPVARIVSP